MKAEQVTALRTFLRAMQVPAEQASRVMAACRDSEIRGQDAWIKTREAATLLRAHPQTLFRYRRKGILHSVKRSARCIRWSKSEVLRLISEGIGHE